jgi:indole-3-glycerol phosphate synthase
LYTVNRLNFTDILQARKRNYVPYEGIAKNNKEPASLIDHIEMARKDGRRPVIAEIKPASPTAGQLRPVDDIQSMALSFKDNGACGISVLTEPLFFGGSIESLQKARCGLPVLRKDFLFHPAQVKESYALGADSILLIAAFFPGDELAAMIGEARSFGMEPLVEVHCEADVERASSAGARLYAINNRDKDTLEIDLRRTERLAPLIDGVAVSASGIGTPEQLKKALEYCDAALVGSALMKAPDPGAALRSLVYGGP